MDILKVEKKVYFEWRTPQNGRVLSCQPEKQDSKL